MTELYTFRIHTAYPLTPPAFAPHAVLACRMKDIYGQVRVMGAYQEDLGELHGKCYVATFSLVSFDQCKDYDFGWVTDGVFLPLSHT